MKFSLSLLSLLFLVAWGQPASANANHYPSALAPQPPPTVAPCINLKQMHADGSEAVKSTCEPSRAGQNMVFDFFATWCHYCVSDLPKFRALADEFKGKAEFRLIGEDEKEQVLRDFFKKNDFTNFAVAFDGKGDAMDGFHVRGTPTIIVIGPDKKIKLFHLGTIETPEELAAIRAAIVSQ
ncbi:MAG TPA: TlpA disulfide reductase family protein [Bdellovibrionota bacterium]|jgi:thiol-disulfide isomerase/thioredoxin